MMSETSRAAWKAAHEFLTYEGSIQFFSDWRGPTRDARLIDIRYFERPLR
jgi:hypothetical protein